ncbi:MAG TPA: hypothetical protein VFC80_04320 [Sphaerochaeta sp.]|nr:hypothetical protein [Sphaerochaeta sp.]
MKIDSMDTVLPAFESFPVLLEEDGGLLQKHIQGIFGIPTLTSPALCHREVKKILQEQNDA